MSCQPGVLYQVYNEGAQGQQALGLGDYKHFMTSKSCLYCLIKPQTTQCTIKPWCIYHIYGTVRSFEEWLHLYCAYIIM